MSPVESASGFVVRVWPVRNAINGSALTVARTATASLTRAHHFDVYCRPLQTTPEAIAEELPVITPTRVLVYAGRIDNRVEIAHRLGKPELARTGDGKLFAEAYEQWGIEFPAKVIGEYSVALIDRLTGRLVAARDSLGIGRLFRYEDTSGVWVASGLEVLLSAIPTRPPYDRAALAEYIASGGLLTSGRTIYRGIAEVQPAHVLVRRQNAEHVQRYWAPDPERRIELRDSREYDERLRVLLFEAVEASMRSSGRVWSDLSGGLDSSTVTAVAAKLASDGRGPASGLTAFSKVVSRTVESDEWEFQQAFLAVYPIAQCVLDNDDHPSFAVDEPQSFHPSKAILYRATWEASARLLAADGAVAHLTGRGGDNVFCGDSFPPVYLSDLVRESSWSRWVEELVAWSRAGRRSLWNLVWHCSWQRQSDLYAGASNKSQVPTWLTAAFRREVSTAESFPWYAGARLYASVARELQYRSILQTAAVARFIRVGDERYPLLYRPLVEFVLAIPWEHLLRPDEDRVIQRRALLGLLPETIRTRKSKTSGTPLLLDGLRKNWQRVAPNAAGSKLSQLGLVEQNGFKAACERLRHGLVAKQYQYLLGALSLEIWLNANEIAYRDPSVLPLYSSTAPESAALSVNAS